MQEAEATLKLNHLIHIISYIAHYLAMSELTTNKTKVSLS